MTSTGTPCASDQAWSTQRFDLKVIRVYVVDDAGDNVIELLSDGVHIIQSLISISLLIDTVENPTTGFTADGNGLVNLINGTIDADLVSGGAGNDRLDGNIALVATDFVL